VIARKKKSDLIPVEVHERAAAAIRVLAHPYRLRIVELLMKHKLTVGQLAGALDLAPNVCSQHLSLMRAHGLLRSTRRGKAVYYQVADPSASNLIRCIRRHALE